MALLLSQSKCATLLATSIEPLRNAAQRTAMSMSQTPLKEHKHITPPSSFVDAPLTPPPTDKKAFTQAPRVIALFKDIQVGRHIKQHPWTEFRLAQGEYNEVERRLKRNESLSGYVRDKIRYVSPRNHRVPANDGNRADMIMTEEVIYLSSACRPAYMSSSLIVLRTQYDVS